MMIEQSRGCSALRGALIGFGVTLLMLMIPIAHFITGPVGPLIGGFVGGGVARANPAKAVLIGLLMGAFTAAPAAGAVFVLQGMEMWETAQRILSTVALVLAVWAGLLGTVGAYFGGRSTGRGVVFMRRMR